MGKQVLIVGAGVGGLCSALRLASKGYKVKILEKNSQAGGRLNQLKKDGFTFDIGPSFFSMSYEFEELARDCNIVLPFEYQALDPLYSVHFHGNNTPFRLYKDIHRLAEQFKDLEPDFERKMKRYLDECKSVFEDTVDVVIKQNFDSLIHYIISLLRVHPKHLPKLMRTFWQEVGRYFTSSEVQQILSLVSFFLGRTPFETPAVFTLLSYTEFVHDGYHNVKGGMYKIVEGFVDELNKMGVEIEYNTEIIDFQSRNGKISALIDANGKVHDSDVFLINADAAVFRGRVMRQKSFDEHHLSKMKWTMGYLTFYLGLDTKLPQVDHHNFYLGADFRAYAEKITQHPENLDNPYYYVNVLSKHNAECAPEDCENLFFVCPVPSLQLKSDWSDRDKVVNGIIDDFSQRIGVDVASHIIYKTIYTPHEWAKMVNLQYGSGLGLSHDLGQIGGFRPKNVDEKFCNLFYVGASTTPGAGIPMAVISSKLTCERIDEFSSV
jgi:phytoene desaturase